MYMNLQFIGLKSYKKYSPPLLWVAQHSWEVGGSGGEDGDCLSLAAVCRVVVVVLAEFHANVLCKWAYGERKVQMVTGASR